jgi:dynein heavy chain
MEKAWSESHNKCPLICLLSPGADPTKLIEDLAKRKKIKTLGVSMGQVRGGCGADVLLDEWCNQD